VQIYADSIVQLAPASKDRIEEISKMTAEDPILSRVVKLTLTGWPRHQRDVPDDIVPFFQQKTVLSIVNGILTFGSRIVIPKDLQHDILNRLHEGHQGVEKTLELAKTCVWWPKLADQVKVKVEQYDLCRSLAPAHRREPLKPSTLPAGPWQRLGADLCLHKSHKYLVITDYYSRFLEILKLSSDTTTANVIAHMKATFARFGIPIGLVTDNGPQFSSGQFAAFMKVCGIIHTTSSPRYP
jgi:hypothetical protein